MPVTRGNESFALGAQCHQVGALDRGPSSGVDAKTKMLSDHMLEILLDLFVLGQDRLQVRRHVAQERLAPVVHQTVDCKMWQSELVFDDVRHEHAVPRDGVEAAAVSAKPTQVAQRVRDHADLQVLRVRVQEIDVVAARSQDVGHLPLRISSMRLVNCACMPTDDSHVWRTVMSS